MLYTYTLESNIQKTLTGSLTLAVQFLKRKVPCKNFTLYSYPGFIIKLSKIIIFHVRVLRIFDFSCFSKTHFYNLRLSRHHTEVEQV